MTVACRLSFAVVLLAALFATSLALNPTDRVTGVFLHHSTGAGVWGVGVPALLTAYNTAHNTNYSIIERAYPTSGYPWANYAYDYWNLWLNGACVDTTPAMECMPKLASQFNVIILKHCFPGAKITASTEAVVSSEAKTLGNYKLQYRALRALMDTYPNNVFIFWTLAPLSPNSATDAATAARAKQFVDWVNNEFLTEDGKSHPNIKIFDFYKIVAEQRAAPASPGIQYALNVSCLASSSSTDSHPNAYCNGLAAPKFVDSIVSSIQARIGSFVAPGSNTTNSNTNSNTAQTATTANTAQAGASTGATARTDGAGSAAAAHSAGFVVFLVVVLAVMLGMN